MAVTLEHGVRRYIGLSTDTKPTVGQVLSGIAITAAELQPGSSFLERDTGRVFRWDGSEWGYSPPNDNVEQLLGALLESVNMLPERIAMQLAEVLASV